MSDITIRPLEQSDHADWRRLWTAYLTFYEATVSEDVYQPPGSACSPRANSSRRASSPLLDGRAVGLVHYLYHRSCWSQVNNCYLQDLFADPAVRGKGVGAALIEAVKTGSRQRSASATSTG